MSAIAEHQRKIKELEEKLEAAMALRLKWLKHIAAHDAIATCLKRARPEELEAIYKEDGEEEPPEKRPRNPPTPPPTPAAPAEEEEEKALTMKEDMALGDKRHQEWIDSLPIRERVKVMVDEAVELKDVLEHLVEHQKRQKLVK